MNYNLIRFIGFVTLIMGLGVVLLNVYFDKDEQFDYIPAPMSLNEEFSIFTPACKIPKLDPYHWSIRGLVKDTSGMKLECKSPAFVLAVNRTLRINKSVVNDTKIVCKFRNITRKAENENELSEPEVIDWETGSEVKSEFVTVECFEGAKGRVYVDFFAFILRKPEVEKRCAERVEKVPLSVLMVGLDSIPKTTYLRHMKLTDKFIREKTNFIEFHGYNKLGYNTFLNILPLTTGKLEEEYDFDLKTSDLNRLPLIWREFSKRGFRTLYGEDLPFGTAFNYLKSGFVGQPTDYYMRPVSVAFDQSGLKKTLAEGCYHNRTEASVVYDWVFDYFNEFKRDPLFAFVFLTILSHDDYNGVYRYDKSVFDLFKGLHEAGHLNRTLVFFFSDHGYHYESVTNTYVGNLESKLPFSFILLPAWFSKVYPRYYENMKINERRLVTPLDVHATLEDLATGLRKVKSKVDPTSRSVSLFSKVPNTRNCKMADIKSSYCTCFERHLVSNESEAVKAGAQKLLDTVNDMTAGIRNVCAKLEMKEVVQVSAHDLNIDEKKDIVYTNYLISFKAAPSDGVFEGTVVYEKKSRKFNVDRTIDRINRYGNQSICINDPRLRLYCYCYTQLGRKI